MMEPASAITDPGWRFDHSYARLPGNFFRRVQPSPAPTPALVCFNATLAQTLGLDFSDWNDTAAAQLFAGNALPPDALPLAQAYAGHQFGNFTMLGDGRAILWGEQLTPDGRRVDLQFKGSGRTPWSRGGDGRATLSSMLREYLISEAIHHLGIPSSRSLAVVATGETVMRQQMHGGAVLTRVAGSHLRVGTFEYARNFLSQAELKRLLAYAIERHDPELAAADNPALAFLNAVMQRQIRLITQWLRVGFIHGVMNTDNMGIAGETFDYGPCAFMNAYDPATVFSSIDQRGRYAFGNQPPIAHWNLGCLAGALLPLIDTDGDAAVAQARKVLDRFPDLFAEAWLVTLRRKLGLTTAAEGDKALVQALLDWMQQQQADYTNTFLALDPDAPTTVVEPIRALPGFASWTARWRERLAQEDRTPADAARAMRPYNPRVIPRNHHVEAVLDAFCNDGDRAPFDRFMAVLRAPDRDPDNPDAMQPPPHGDVGYQTFCGT